MRNILKAATLENKFPLLSVEEGCILSKDADVTVGFKVLLPEIFTLTSTDYEAMHGAWTKAIRVLPHHTIVHRQDAIAKLTTMSPVQTVCAARSTVKTA